jgi:hypothetical protein
MKENFKFTEDGKIIIPSFSEIEVNEKELDELTECQVEHLKFVRMGEE